MINIYSPEEINLISQSGKITANAQAAVFSAAKPGVTTQFLDKLAEKLIRDAGGEPSFMLEKGYHWTTCLNVNDMVVHGIPTNYVLQDGDRLGIDLGTVFKGFHSDASWSITVGGVPRPQVVKFLSTGQKALEIAISRCVPGNHIGDISQAIQETIEGGGYSCVKQLVGHGVGRKLHEDPEIPCYLRGKISRTPEIKVGMVLAVEAIYNQGKSPVVYSGGDGWTIITADGSLSGLFEHTVAVTANGPNILTQ